MRAAFVVTTATAPAARAQGSAPGARFDRDVGRAAGQRLCRAVINVTVPSGTPASDPVYLSGNYDVLGTGIGSYDDWLAMDYPMVKTGPDTWTLAITGVPAASFQYKFTLGTWSSAEETASCGFVSNRTFTFNDADATFTANDTVAAWTGIGSC